MFLWSVCLLIVCKQLKGYVLASFYFPLRFANLTCFISSTRQYHADGKGWTVILQAVNFLSGLATFLLSAFSKASVMDRVLFSRFLQFSRLQKSPLNSSLAKNLLPIINSMLFLSFSSILMINTVYMLNIIILCVPSNLASHLCKVFKPGISMVSC